MPAIATLDLSSFSMESFSDPVLAKSSIAFTTFPYPENTEDPVFLGIKPKPRSMVVYIPTDPIIRIPPMLSGTLSVADPYRLGPETMPEPERLALSIHQADFPSLSEYYEPYLLETGENYILLKNPEHPIYIKVAETSTPGTVVRIKASSQADLDLLQLS